MVAEVFPAVNGRPAQVTSHRRAIWSVLPMSAAFAHAGKHYTTR